MVDQLLEEDEFHLSRECDFCRDLYITEDGYTSLIDLELAFCSEGCAQKYEAEY